MEFLQTTIYWDYLTVSHNLLEIFWIKLENNEWKKINKNETLSFLSIKIGINANRRDVFPFIRIKHSSNDKTGQHFQFQCLQIQCKHWMATSQWMLTESHNN